MIDRRLYKRFELAGVDIVSRLHFLQDVILHDISLGGASIGIEQPLSIGQQYELRIHQADDSVFAVNAEVVWLEDLGCMDFAEDDSSHLFKAGLRFQSIFTTKGDRLAGLIEEKARSDRERCRVRGVRVKLRQPRAELDCHGQFPVIEISFGGMRIETEQPLEKGNDYQINMSIPGAMKPVHCTGRIASSVRVPESSPPKYRSGIEFLSMGTKDLERIRELIYSLTDLTVDPKLNNLTRAD